MKVRQGRGSAEGARQPRARSSADQPLVEEAVSGEVRQPVLAEVEGAECNEHSDERLDHVEAAVVRHLQAQVIELFIETGLGADRSSLAFVAGPAFDRIATTVSDVERAADVPLRRFAEARELLHFGDQHSPACRLAGPRNHEPDSSFPGGIMRRYWFRET